MSQPDDLRNLLLDFSEEILKAQLQAVKRLRTQKPSAPEPASDQERMSQIDVVFDILQQAHQPLHISDIIIHAQQHHHLTLDRESIVSALAKRIARGDRFVRTAPNTFALRKE